MIGLIHFWGSPISFRIVIVVIKRNHLVTQIVARATDARFPQDAMGLTQQPRHNARHILGSAGTPNLTPPAAAPTDPAQAGYPSQRSPVSSSRVTPAVATQVRATPAIATRTRVTKGRAKHVQAVIAESRPPSRPTAASKTFFRLAHRRSVTRLFTSTMTSWPARLDPHGFVNR